MGYLQHAAQRGRTRHPRPRLRSDALPSPTKGLNSRDSLMDVEPGYALRLINYFPEGQSLELREGTLRDTTSPLQGGRILGLPLVRSGSTIRRYAVDMQGGFFDVTSGEPTLLTVMTPGLRPSYAEMNNHTILCNGASYPTRIAPDGSFIHDHEWEAPGLNPTKLNGALSHKNRIFFYEEGTPNIWYGGLFSVKGLLTKFPLAGVARSAGKVVAIGDMTMDGGDGPDDRIFFFMESGAVLGYAGSDIADASTWSLTGSYELPKLVGDDPLVKMQGDLLAITAEGIVSLSSMQRTGREGALGSALTTNIYNRFRDLAIAFGTEPGWGSFVSGGKLVISIPVPGGTQLVMNNVTGAWCEFKGMDAYSWVADGEDVWFGADDGHVYKAFDERAGNSDEANTENPAYIEGLVQTAYSTFRNPWSKHFKMARVHLEATGDIDYDTGLLLDYDTEPPQPAHRTVSIGGGSRWNEAEWNEAEWGGRLRTVNPWQSVDRMGTSASLYVSSRTRGVKVQVHGAEVKYISQRGVLV